VCRQGLFELLEVWLFLSTPDAMEFLAEQVRCDCDLIVLCLASRLVDDWPPVLKVTIIGCFPNLYQMTHSIELLFPRDHIPQLVELLTLGYFVLDTRSHPCLVVFQFSCFQRLARVLDVLDGVVQDVETRLRRCLSAG